MSRVEQELSQQSPYFIYSSNNSTPDAWRKLNIGLKTVTVMHYITIMCVRMYVCMYCNSTCIDLFVFRPFFLFIWYWLYLMCVSLFFIFNYMCLYCISKFNKSSTFVIYIHDNGDLASAVVTFSQHMMDTQTFESCLLTHYIIWLPNTPVRLRGLLVMKLCIPSVCYVLPI